MKLISRLLYSSRMLKRHRFDLSKIYREHPAQLSLTDILPEQLQQQGIRILVLDFDGVLAAHGETMPTPEIHEWLQRSVTIFGANQVFILSNKPMPKRIAYFAHHFAGVRFITGVKKKPYPDGLQKILQLTQALPEQIVLIDDRLLTGCLAACIAKTRVIYITRPYASFRRRPVKERFFWGLRLFERQLFRWYGSIQARRPKI